MKKIFALLLCVVFAVSMLVLAGCKKDSKEATKPATTTQQNVK